MGFKVILIIFLYNLVTTEQRTIEKIAIDNKQMEELQNLLQQLELQINKEHKIHKHLGQPKNKGITEDNPLTQRNDYIIDKSEDMLVKKADRDCKYGRCGCSGPRCGDNRDESNSDEVEKLLDSLEKTIDNDMGHNQARCGHGRCGKDGDGSSGHLRCKDGRCEKNKNRIDDKDVEPYLIDNPDIKQQLGRYGKTYKLNKHLDAIVLDAESVDDAINQLNKHCKYANCKFIDYNSNSRTTDINKEEDTINAVILDLTHLPESKNFEKIYNNGLVKSGGPQKTYFSPGEMHKYYPDYKRTAVNDMVGNIKDKSERREAEKYLTNNQKQLVENVKFLFLKSGIGLDDKQVVKQVEHILFGKYNPEKNIGHGKLKRQDNLRAQKRLLPLTIKQRNRLYKKAMHLWRRNSNSNYGLPFDFQVQGLGQVIP